MVNRSYTADYVISQYQTNSRMLPIQCQTAAAIVFLNKTHCRMKKKKKSKQTYFNAMVGITSEETKGYGLSGSARAVP